VRDRQSAVGRWLTRQRDDSRQLLWRKRRRRSGTPIVAEHAQDELLEVFLLGALSFRGSQSWCSLGPAPPPTTNALSVDTQLIGLVLVFSALGRHQDDAAALDHTLWQ
jgi:hypothetical protein